MKLALIALLAAVAMLLAGLPAAAHHSFAGTYDVSKEITIKGKIVEVSLRSPHSFFFVEDEDEKGAPRRWSIEGASASQFAQQGVTKDALKVGDVVEITANPARSMITSFRARLIKILRPSDGWSWGGRPNESFQ